MKTPTITEKRPRADWEAIERDYRAGVLSVKEMGRVYGLSDVAIHKRAKKEGWTRDLSFKVQNKVRDALVRQEMVSAGLPPYDPQTENQIVDNAAAQVVAVIRGHRASIQRLTSVAESLLAELSDQTINREAYAELGELLRSDDPNMQDRRNDLYNKIISGSSRIDGIKKLSDTIKNIIQLDRQAYNISDHEEDPNKNDSPLADRMNAARERARLNG